MRGRARPPHCLSVLGFAAAIALSPLRPAAARPSRALPRLCFSVPWRRRALLRCCYAAPCRAMPLQGIALGCHAEAVPCFAFASASRCKALPLQFSSRHCCAVSMRCITKPFRSCVALSYSAPCLCLAPLCFAVALPAVSRPILSSAVPVALHCVPALFRCNAERSGSDARPVQARPLRRYARRSDSAAWRCKSYAPYSVSGSMASHVNVPLPLFRHWHSPRRRP